MFYIVRFVPKSRYFTILTTLLVVSLLTSCFPDAGKVSPDITDYGFDEAYEPIIDSILNLLTLEEKIHMI